MKYALPWLERREPSITNRPAVGEAAAREQRLDARARRASPHRRELVEQRRDAASGRAPGSAAGRRSTRPTPTATTACPAARISHSTSTSSGRPSADARSAMPFARSASHRAARHPVEAEALLDAERVPARERQVDGPEITPATANISTSRHSADTARHRSSATIAARPPPSVIASSSSASTSTCSIDEPLLGDRVVGGLLVRGSRCARRTPPAPRRGARGRGAIWRRASQRRTPSDARSAGTKRVVKAEAVTGGQAAGVRQSGLAFYAHRHAPRRKPPDLDRHGNDRPQAGHATASSKSRSSSPTPTSSRVAEAPVWVVHQDDAVLDGMDAWNQGTHGKLGAHRQGEGRPREDEAGVEARRWRSCASTCRPRRRRCAATRSARTAASSRAGCPRSRTSSITAISTSRR